MNTKNAFSTLLTVLITAAVVGVLTGVIIYSYAASKKDLEIEGLKEQLSQVKEEGVDETANWKTYTNDKYGFSFKYPKEYLIDKENGNIPGEIIFKKKGAISFPYISLKVENNSDNLSLREWGEKSRGYKLTSEEEEKYKNIVINNIEGLRKDEKLTKGGKITITLEVLLRGNKMVVSLMLFGIEAENNKTAINNYVSIFNTMLSTFQFTK